MLDINESEQFFAENEKPDRVWKWALMHLRKWCEKTDKLLFTLIVQSPKRRTLNKRGKVQQKMLNDKYWKYIKEERPYMGQPK